MKYMKCIVQCIAYITAILFLAFKLQFNYNSNSNNK